MNPIIEIAAWTWQSWSNFAAFTFTTLWLSVCLRFVLRGLRGFIRVGGSPTTTASKEEEEPSSTRWIHQRSEN